MDNLNKNIRKDMTEQVNFTGLIVTIALLTALAVFFDIRSIQAWVEGAGIWAPLIFVLLKISTIVLAPLSGSPLYPLVGLLFGFWPGILFVVLGDFLGYTISFYISRIFGRDIAMKFVAQREGGLLDRVVKLISTAKGFFYTCLAFFALPEVLSYGAGLSSLPYRKFIFILMPFSILASTILVFFGSILDLETGSLAITLGIPILGIIAVLSGGYFFLREIKKQTKE